MPVEVRGRYSNRIYELRHLLAGFSAGNSTPTLATKVELDDL